LLQIKKDKRRIVVANSININASIIVSFFILIVNLGFIFPLVNSCLQDMTAVGVKIFSFSEWGLLVIQW